MATPVMMVHGGAWSMPDNFLKDSHRGIKDSVRAGYAVLERGGTALDAVQAAVVAMEDNPDFDAGIGSVLTSEGDVEMDAVIMCGKTLNAGGVACVHNIKNPILLAREVMEKTKHVLLVGKGANLFAEEVGIKTIPTETLVSEEAIREHKCYKEYGGAVDDLFRQRGTEPHNHSLNHDTVGAVALDKDGNLAFATSTGGISGKRPGRVGDSPVIGDEIWNHGYGYEVISTAKAVDSESSFNIGSVTKSFTATLVGMLLKEKGLNWSAKVADILGPSYEFVDTYRTKEITSRDLLSHRTGLARLDFGANAAGISKAISRSQFCQKMKYLPEELPFRDGLIYNNYMYMMAGHVSEKLGNDTWEQLITTKVLQPLGMNNTKFMDPTTVVEDHAARPYVYVPHDDVFVNGTLDLYTLYPMDPAGAIMSTGVDMAKWIKFHLSLGKTESGVQLLDKKLVAAMHQATTVVNSERSKTKPSYPVDDVYMGYGYGFYVSEYRGYRKVWHSGSWGSYISMIWLFPDMNLGLFASLNGPGSEWDAPMHLETIFPYISDLLLNEQQWLNASTACTYPEPWSKPWKSMGHDIVEKPLAVGNIDELVGTYTNNVFADLVVYLKSAVLHMDSNRLHAVLHPSSEKDRFLYELKSPIEFALPIFNHTRYFMNVTFERQPLTQVVNAITLHQEVDVRYEKKLQPQPVG